MSRVQLKRRKRREKGSVSVKSIICATIGAAALVVLAAGIYTAVSGKPDRTVTGAMMIFFFASLCSMCFGIRFSKREGFTPASRFWGVFLPVAAFVGFLLLYIIGLLKVL